MADSPNRPNYGSLSNRSTASRRSRPSMRVPSARSSVAYDDYPSHLHPHALRSVSSRFSLGDFAATRSEFDFDDDASSIFERATVASEAGDVAGDKFVAVGGLNLDLDQVNGPGQMVIEHREEDDEGGSSGDYYDLLCLPRDPLLTPRRIRRAYWTLLALLLDDTYPENLSPLATAYLNQAQQAFETLIDPARRVHYDMRSRAWLITDDDSQKENFEELYEDALVHHQWLVQRRDFESSAVTLRLDASALVQGARQLGNRNVLLQPLDFALSQSVTTALPHFRRFLMSLVDDRRLASHVRATGALTELTAAPNIYLPAPELTLSGSAYGLFDVVAIPTSLPDLIHPLHTPLTPSPKLQRLAPRAFSPGVNLDLHQDILRRTADGGVLKSFVQFYCDPLGRRLGTRLSHEVAVGKKPLTIEVNTQSSRIASQTLSQAAAGLSYSVANGLAYISAGSDGWRGDMIGTLSANQNRVEGGGPSVGLPLGPTPTLELGFATASVRSLTALGRYDPRLTSGGIYGLDHETDGPEDGSWSAHASLTSSTATGSLRYSRDVSGLGSSLSGTDSRIEIELASNSMFERHLAVRNLWRVGVHAKLGLEVGVGSHAFHLSLYWSRLKHRFSLPLLLSSPGTTASVGVVFWAALLPFLAMAGVQYVSIKRPASKAEVSGTSTTERIESRMARKRAEAEEVAALLTGPVEAKQQRRREIDGLVILDAKYGVQSALEDGSGSLWSAGKVANVTVATAALIDSQGRLVIPAGVRKSGVLGFWDPAPGTAKVLQVRYVYGGKEGVVDVKGRRALVLPPMQDDV
ncbi:Chaperone protein dnaJ 13 like [Verticillium longisporum]